MESITSVHETIGIFIQRTNCLYLKTGLQIYLQYPHNWRELNTQKLCYTSENITDAYPLEPFVSEPCTPGSGNRVSDCMVLEILYVSNHAHKSPYAYGHHHTGMGLHTCMVFFSKNVQVSFNIGPHTGMVRV